MTDPEPPQAKSEAKAEVPLHSLVRLLVRLLRPILTPLLEEAVERALVGAMRRGDPPLIILPEADYEAYRMTAEVLDDEQALEDLRLAEQEPNEQARPYEEIRRELGLA